MPFIDLRETLEREVCPGCWMRAAHSEKMTVTYWRLETGALLPEHAHRHEQVTSLITGDLELMVGGETRRIVPGIAATIPSNTPHSAKAMTECYVIDVFYPVREDYR